MPYGEGGGTNATLYDYRTTSDNDPNFPESPISNYGYGSLATHVIQSFGLSLMTDGGIGSALPLYDIHKKPAYSMIQLSLAYELVHGNIYECYADEQGFIRYYLVGAGGTNQKGTIYYEMEGYTYQLPCDKVVVVGYDPPPTRRVEFGKNLFTLGTSDDDIFNRRAQDEPELTGPVYWTMDDIFPGCKRGQGWIEYNKLDWGDARAVKDAYNLDNFDSHISTLYNVHVPFFEQSSTTVEFRNSTTRPVFLPFDQVTMISFDARKWVGWKPESDAFNCIDPPDPPLESYITIPGSLDRKFLGVSGVYIYGYKINRVFPYRFTRNGPVIPYAWLETQAVQPFQLTRGEHYVLNRDENGTRITFSCNAYPEYLDFYNHQPILMKLHESCVYLTREGYAYYAGQRTETKDGYYMPEVVRGYLKDGTSAYTYQPILEYLFPMGNGESAYAVRNLVILLEWDNPCVYIKDERGQLTEDVLGEVSVEVAPIIMRDLPAAAGMATARGSGAIANTGITPTSQPTQGAYTSRSSDWETSTNGLNNGDIMLTLPFLASDECHRVAKYIYEIRNSGTEEKIYLCGPDASPELGAYWGDNNSVVNEITYSYQDSSQYTITVQVGPKWRDLGSGWSQSMNRVTSRNKTIEGRVISASDDNSRFKVLCEQIGVINCVNSTQTVICNGDRVQVNIYNYTGD